MEWVRGDILGKGSFGTVNLAIPRKNSPQNLTPIVVKSSEIPSSESLKNEKKVLSLLGNSHPHIIQFLGDSLSSENGTQLYNLFLEYARKGSLSDQLRISGGKFESSDVKRYTKSILEGLSYIHEKGFVHGDVKLQNILLFEDGFVKIADFGLAKRTSSEKTGDCQLRGTPMYMSPEIVAGAGGESPSDIWALGCAVVEMVTGDSPWNCSPESDVSALLYRIGVRGESPVIPGNLCPEGKDFLGKCFVKDPNERWTARMLLDHPFISGFSNPCSCNYEEQPCSVSPRCPFELLDWELSSSSSSSSSSSPSSNSDSIGFFNSIGFSRGTEISCWSSISGRFGQEWVSDGLPEWNSSCDEWVTVR